LGRALVWLAGDVSSYEVVAYRFSRGSQERGVRGFLSAEALAAAYPGGFERYLVIVPDTLFRGDHCKAYFTLIRAKAGCGNLRLLRGETDATLQDEEVRGRFCGWMESILGSEGGRLECVVVPHPGVAGPIILEEAGARAVRLSYGEPRRGGSGGAGFNSLLNSVYAALRRLASSGYSLVVDLTHGTNPLVSAALLAAATIQAVYGPGSVEGAYMAPVMGRPDPNTPVDFIDVMDAINAANHVVAGINAWRRLDERLLAREALEGAGSVLGPKYKEFYGNLKKILNRSGELLWVLRSGQLPLVPGLLDGLSGVLGDASNSLDTIIRYQEALSLDTPWTLVADAVVQSALELAGRLRGGSWMETVLRSARVLLEEGMPDRALGPLRELAVAALLARALGASEDGWRVGGDKWQAVESLLHSCSRLGLGCGDLGISKDEAGVYDRARQYRNMLMHGRISREEGSMVRVGPGGLRVELGRENGKPLPRGEVGEAAEGLIGLLERLTGGGQPGP
jgi:hypothetical protein